MSGLGSARWWECEGEMNMPEELKQWINRQQATCVEKTNKGDRKRLKEDVVK